MNRFPQLQIANLKAVLQQIEDHPETWNQGGWHCNTSHCVGGWAQVMSGKEEDSDYVVIHARKWLSLSETEAKYLFNAYRTLDQIRTFVKQAEDCVNGNEFPYYGYDRNGRDKNGLNRQGIDIDGYDIHGYDSDGLDRNNQERPK